jgi:hypothetical protein
MLPSKKSMSPLRSRDIHQGLRVLKYEEALLFSLKNQIVRGENRAFLKTGAAKSTARN